MYYLASSVVVVGVEDCPPFGDLGCALRHRPTLVPGITLVSPRGCRTKGLPMAKRGVVTSLCHPVRSCARCAHSVNTVGRLKWYSSVPRCRPKTCHCSGPGFRVVCCDVRRGQPEASVGSHRFQELVGPCGDVDVPVVYPELRGGAAVEPEPRAGAGVGHDVYFAVDVRCFFKRWRKGREFWYGQDARGSTEVPGNGRCMRS